jgi:hypothetical protein
MQGLKNQNLTFKPQKDKETENAKLTINKQQIERLIREYPTLKEIYESSVPQVVSDKQFWDEFLKKNYQNKTEVFLGNNPIFYPMQDNEYGEDYEFKINNYKGPK